MKEAEKYFRNVNDIYDRCHIDLPKDVTEFS